MYIFICGIGNFFVTEVTIVSECLLLKRVTLSCHLVRSPTFFLFLSAHGFEIDFGRPHIFGLEFRTNKHFFLKIAFNLPLRTDTSRSFVVRSDLPSTTLTCPPLFPESL